MRTTSTDEEVFEGEMHERLYRLIRENLTLEQIAGILGIGVTEAHRKCTNQRGFTIGQFAKLLDSVGAKIAGKNEIVLTHDRYQACLVGIKRFAELELQNVQGANGMIERRRDRVNI